MGKLGPPGLEWVKVGVIRRLWTAIPGVGDGLLRRDPGVPGLALGSKLGPGMVSTVLSFGLWGRVSGRIGESFGVGEEPRGD